MFLVWQSLCLGAGLEPVAAFGSLTTKTHEVKITKRHETEEFLMQEDQEAVVLGMTV
jgi:hypothetical protein